MRCLQTQYEEAETRIGMERSIFNQDLDTALHSLSQHKQQISSLVQKTHLQVNDVTEEMFSLKV